MSIKTAQSPKYMRCFLILLALAVILPELTETYFFDIIVQIRQSIHSGDSGFLILAAMASCILYTIPNLLFYLSFECLLAYVNSRIAFSLKVHNLILGFCFVLGKTAWSTLLHQPSELVTSLVALWITLGLVYLTKHKARIMMPRIFIGFQVFFFSQWLNVMPIFAGLRTGTSDIPISIKIASDYLQNTYILNSIGFAFIVPMFLSSFMTAMIFRMYMTNLSIAEENYQRAIALETMQNKIMDNRIYQEINALAHDLKTPLATIRGLSSLLALAKDVDKIETYGNRIDQAVVKMSEMISSFLYGTSRQWIEVSALISYIRAQIPVEDEHIQFTTAIEDNIPALYVNKIRVARALVNLIENAILAPCVTNEKVIKLNIFKALEDVVIVIQDNGMGIAEVDLNKIWQIGYSTNNTTGLGLPFAKQTIDENEGTIQIESQYGIGTQVIVKLPIIEKGEITCPA
ncbi:sensor histidine kinase KdpD [Fusibacter sp. 3D3]|uniref:sensor histidine kinase n=1 Tax=Fusibacter sp. 3D3 TaxID=1048380 RepID=UPI0008535F56|nr:HAMP domain-containing sensor histidine kinase [Fusibacter sp. 3D3]GAU78464.1 sensor histidine kinase [Fusibacter sp. 3D3]